MRLRSLVAPALRTSNSRSSSPRRRPTGPRTRQGVATRPADTVEESGSSSSSAPVSSKERMRMVAEVPSGMCSAAAPRSTSSPTARSSAESEGTRVEDAAGEERAPPLPLAAGVAHLVAASAVLRDGSVGGGGA